MRPTAPFAEGTAARCTDHSPHRNLESETDFFAAASISNCLSCHANSNYCCSYRLINHREFISLSSIFVLVFLFSMPMVDDCHCLLFLLSLRQTSVFRE